MKGMTSRYLVCLGREIHLTEWAAPGLAPDAPVLVAWHGLARSGRDFDVLARQLCDRWRVICPDTVGRGLSQWAEDPAAEYHLGAYVALAESLIGKGLQLEIYDPEVYLSRILGANKKFLDTHLPHIGPLLHDRIDDLIANCDSIVLAIKDPRAMDALSRLARPDQWLFDLVGIPQSATLPCVHEGLCW
jgi:hypothetical protein